MSIIDEYLSKLAPEQKQALEHVRQVVRDNFPKAEDTIGYGMPVMKLNGKYLLGFSAFKDHLSIFPGAYPIEQLKGRLKGYKTSKGTIQFTLDKPLPDELLQQILILSVEAMHK